jgi:hypothetical protein
MCEGEKVRRWEGGRRRQEALGKRGREEEEEETQIALITLMVSGPAPMSRCLDALRGLAGWGGWYRRRAQRRGRQYPISNKEYPMSKGGEESKRH